MFDNPLAITFTLYILLMVAIGFAAWRHTRNLSDYILGGRSLGPFVTAMSTGASDMSGWLLMGLPGALYAAGLVEAWIAIGLIFGAWFNWFVVAGRLRVYTEQCENALTLPDYFGHRFEDRSRILRLSAALVILIFFTIYCASGMVAGARLFEEIFGLSYGSALYWGAAATILYVFVGGFLAVSWTDTVQALLMLFALLLVPVLLWTQLGGYQQIVQTIAAHKPAALNPWQGTTIIGIVSLLAWGLGYMGQPHILARFMAAENYASIKTARRWAMAWMILCLGGAMTTGFFAMAYFAVNPQHAAPVLANRETVFITLAQVLFNPWIAGVLLSAILAAVMSTLSCQLLVSAAALTEDFYKPFLRPNASQTELVWCGRAMVLLVSLIAIWIAGDPNSQILGMVGYAWAGFGAAFGPIVLMSLLWSRMNRNGAIAGMLVGAATVILWHNGQWFGQAQGPLFGLYELLPGFVFASAAIVIASLLSAPPSAAITARFNAVQVLTRPKSASN